MHTRCTCNALGRIASSRGAPSRTSKSVRERQPTANITSRLPMPVGVPAMHCANGAHRGRVPEKCQSRADTCTLPRLKPGVGDVVSVVPVLPLVVPALVVVLQVPLRVRTAGPDRLVLPIVFLRQCLVLGRGEKENAGSFHRTTPTISKGIGPCWPRNPPLESGEAGRNIPAHRSELEQGAQVDKSCHHNRPKA